MGVEMKIRIIGNSCSGKTTLTRMLKEYYSVPALHLDSIAFVPNSNFELRDTDVMRKDISTFVASNNKWIIEGNYINTTAAIYNLPDIVIFIDLPVEQSLYNFQQRYLQFEGKSRPELPNLVETDKEEMIEWISSYPDRRQKLTNYIVHEQMQNPLVHILHVEDMGEVKALCNNPHLIEGFFEL